MTTASPATVLLSGAPIDPALVGGKGDALNHLIATGANVPPTGSITTSAYRWFVEESGLDRFLDGLRRSGAPSPSNLAYETERIDAAFLDAAMPAGLAGEIGRLADAVRGAGLLAVRSSATGEDTAAASFAGQYRSFLEVDDAALLESVRRVWSSLWHPAPRAYRAHAGVAEDDLAMAIVVMRMVAATRAGVIFTVNPAGTGAEMRIEAVDGLAEQLVSGEVTPDAWVVSRVAGRRSSIDAVIDEVIDAALEIEARFEAPQDVEWAHDGDQLYIVQARPITTLGASAAQARDGFDSVIGAEHTYTTAGIAESMPGVLPPLQWTTAAPLLENGFRHLFDQMGALPDLADEIRFLARVSGRAMLSLDLMKAAALEVPGGSSEEIERQYFGRVISTDDAADREASGARGPFKGLRTMLAGVREINARRRFRFEAEASIDAIQRLLLDPPDCQSVTADQLLAYRHRVLDLAGRVMAAEVAVAASAAAAYRGVELFLERHVGAEAAQLAQQLTAGGIDPCGAQVSFHTCDLVGQALADAELAAAFESLSAREASARDTLALLGRGGELIADVDAELARAGSTAVFSGETWAEAEGLAWQLLSQAVQVDCRGRPTMTRPEDRGRLLAAVEARFATSWKYRMQRVMTGQIIDLRKRMLRRIVADAVEFLHLREKTKSAVLALGGEVRRVHLAIGRHLVAAGALGAPYEVDLLAAYELEPALNSHAPTRWELTRRRDAFEALRDAEPLPQLFTGDPSHSVGEVAPTDADTFTGWAASTGVYEGPARVITKASQPIEPGDILVARTTDPAWTPLFLTAGAIVVEEGGPLSHAAIIAREFNLPAVLNVPGFLARLAGTDPDVVRLRVDGDRGTVEILDHSPIDEPSPTEAVAAP